MTWYFCYCSTGKTVLKQIASNNKRDNLKENKLSFLNFLYFPLNNDNTVTQPFVKRINEEKMLFVWKTLIKDILLDWILSKFCLPLFGISHCFSCNTQYSECSQSFPIWLKLVQFRSAEQVASCSANASSTHIQCIIHCRVQSCWKENRWWCMAKFNFIFSLLPHCSLIVYSKWKLLCNSLPAVIPSSTQQLSRFFFLCISW